MRRDVKKNVNQHSAVRWYYCEATASIANRCAAGRRTNPADLSRGTNDVQLGKRTICCLESCHPRRRAWDSDIRGNPPEAKANDRGGREANSVAHSEDI